MLQDEKHITEFQEIFLKVTWEGISYDLWKEKGRELLLFMSYTYDKKYTYR